MPTVQPLMNGLMLSVEKPECYTKPYKRVGGRFAPRPPHHALHAGPHRAVQGTIPQSNPFLP